MNLNIKANSRTSNIIVQNIDAEVLVYDLKNNQALSLNETAAMVWHLLDGKKTVAEIARQSNLPPEIVLLSIHELNRKNLLEENVETGLANDRLSRRKMLTKSAATAFALPIIVAITAPMAIHAQSVCNPPSPPGTPSQMLNPGAMSNVGYSGVCDAPCPAVCASFNFDCCSNSLLYAGTCTNNGGGAGIAVCACTCE
jgi:hypothetical protein